MADAFDPGKDKKDCGDYPAWGRPSKIFSYIFKSNAKEDDYPPEACDPYYHSNAQIDEFRVNNDLTVGGRINCSANAVPRQSWKGFDIPHPSKENHRLRHICLEGPEGGVYVRGRLTNSNVIDLPEYWTNLIDPESITVTLTQIGSSQDLLVDKIEWGRRIKILSGNSSNIDCYYVVHAARIDGEKLIVEYEGTTPADYPGDSTQYSISGYDYGAKGVDRAD